MLRDRSKIKPDFTASKFCLLARRDRRTYPTSGSVRSGQPGQRPKEPAGGCETILARTLKMFRLAVVFALSGALVGCSGTTLHNLVYGYRNPNNWLNQARTDPWIQQRVSLSPLTSAQARQLEAMALQECVGPSYVLQITMGQSPAAQAQRQRYGQNQQGWQLYAAVAPAYAVLLITARQGDVQAQTHLADFYAQESQDFVPPYGQTGGMYNPYAAYGALEQAQNQPRSYVALSTILRHAAEEWANQAAIRAVIDGRSDFDLGMIYQCRASVAELNYPAKLWNRPAGFRRANMSTALHWYKLSAGQGYAAAENCLGDIYTIGAPGIVPNAARAFHWYRLAAAQGVPNAEYQLARAYRYGLGTQTNIFQSTIWLNRAVAAKWPLAIDLAAHIFMKPVVAAAQRGNPAVQLRLALAYYNGHYKGYAIPKNYVKAFYWFKKCSPSGKVRTDFYLGRCYQVGLGTAVNYPKAAAWYQLAAKQGNGAAENNIGIMYERGDYFAQSDAKAAACYMIASHEGNAQATSNLNAMLRKDIVQSPHPQEFIARLNNSISAMIEGGMVHMAIAQQEQEFRQYCQQQEQMDLQQQLDYAQEEEAQAQENLEAAQQQNDDADAQQEDQPDDQPPPEPGGD